MSYNVDVDEINIKSIQVDAISQVPKNKNQYFGFKHLHRLVV